MKLSYDSVSNIAYLRLREKREQVRTVRVSDELAVDLAPDGRVYGIELLNANAQIGQGDAGKLVVVDEATGVSQEMDLSGVPGA